MFFSRTWPIALLIATLWLSLLLVWVLFPPPFVNDVRDFDVEIAISYRDLYLRCAKKLRNLWIVGGIFVLSAYVFLIWKWPNQGWIVDSFVPFVRTFGELCIGVAFSLAVDLMFRAAPILARFIMRDPESWRLGRTRAPVRFFLGNVNLLFASVLLVVSLIHYQGTISEIMVSVSAALIIGRYVGSLSTELDLLVFRSGELPEHTP